MKFHPIIAIIALSISINNQIFTQYVPKTGGICFRTDDNQPMDKYYEYDQLFSSYGKKFTFAITLGKEQITHEYVEMLKLLQSHGHEMMDHTPWHNTFWFSTILPTEFYIDHPGVHNIREDNIELAHEPVDTNYAKQFSKRNGYINLNGNLVSSDEKIFKYFNKEDCYLYFPLLDTLVFIDDKNGWIDEYTVKIKSFWKKDIDLGVHENIQFYNFDNSNIHLTIDALRALTQETQRLAEHFGLEKPTAWIQPGGYFPRIYKNELKLACEDQGYKAAGVFTDPGLKVFNEYNPFDDKQFGMDYGDFRDDIWTLEKCKEIIADRTAKHHVVFGLSHFTWMELLGGWDGFLNRTEGIIQWCIDQDIPIRTYTEWADQLYYQTPDPYENIIPKLNTDRDANGIPDGYDEETMGDIFTSNDSTSINEVYYSIDKEGKIYSISNLGGIEKGDNFFSIWLKGVPGNEVNVEFKHTGNTKVYDFLIDDDNWKLYTIDESINQNNLLFIPEHISLLDIKVNCSKYIEGNVLVGQMALHKPKEKDVVENRVELRGNKISFINKNIGAYIESSKNLVITHDGSQSWDTIHFDIDDNLKEIVFTDVNTSWIITDSTLYKSVDGGRVWTLSKSFNHTQLYSVYFRDNSSGFIGAQNLKANDYSAKILYTHDGGETWNSSNFDSTHEGGFCDFSFVNDTVGLAVSNSNVYKTINGGIYWNELPISWNTSTGGAIGAKILTENKIILSAWRPNVVADGYLLESEDGGETWNSFGVSKYFWGSFSDCFVLNQDTVFINSNNYMYKTTDHGNTWDTSGVRLDNFSFYNECKAYGIDYNNKYILHTTDAWSSYNVVDSILTNVKTNINIPVEFSLEQNYPNPFNPVTRINYSIPSNVSTSIRLNVFDVLGREITTLVNEPQRPGKHSTVFDATNLSSGVYYYQLTVGDLIKTKKMIFIK